MAEQKIFGYASKISVKQGEEINFHVSADGAEVAQAQLVRLVHGDNHKDGPGFIEQEIGHAINGRWAVRKQFTQLGNFLRVDDPKRLLKLDGSLSMFCFIWPTMPKKGKRQIIMGRWDTVTNEGFALGINPQGYLEFWVGNGKEVDYVTAELPLIEKVWYFVGVSFDHASGKAEIYQESVLNRYNSLIGTVVPYDFASHVQTKFRFRQHNQVDTPFVIAGARDFHILRGYFVGDLYSGKIDRPCICRRPLTRPELDACREGKEPPKDAVAAYWDTSVGYTENGIGNTVVDTGPQGLSAVGVNNPVRGMTGWNWNGKNDCFRLAPGEFGGIEFHADAVTDCKWPVTNTMTIPADLKSGAYAIRLRIGPGQGLSEEYIVFFVRSSRPSAKLCFLVPTGSYLAYANESLSFDAQIIQPMTGQPPVVTDIDIETYEHGEFGFSTYNNFEDGAGVCFTSYKRPIINMRPKYRMSSMNITWQFPADLSIVAWLDHNGYDCDFITDEDLHREGLDAIKPYNCVMTGTHPEYVSERMLDAQEDFVSGGGRIIYMGGNGYYWCVGYMPDEPACMEVRKLDSGMRAWAARSGEHYLASTGEKSGLWRNRGRAPQKLLGVGMISEGFETCAPYRKMPDAFHRTVSWITEGVEGEIIGDRGLAYGAAAGIEIDRYDLSLGTPPHTKIIASSGGHSDNYVLVTEEILYAYAGMVGSLDYRIRADMTYFTSLNNGAVFSTGSIGFGQALPANRFDNSASKLLKNVVDAFIVDGKLPGQNWTLEEKQWR
ncbi:N,N-dimethylformamidase beta subunit family domain-containing protein [Sinorhizobium meliloti]|uniref:N,N-dimethylformamidase beta subunit family domain-containing protein n=1 Tax=Rhizobium meliloti TaxID=382 RepID=UPI002090FBC9|nr:N,N-dimethylformamidase beta subunit family domain-containing protein [Sinorhizobium meliloti]MCO5966355.1 LamG domain-containing protein [Sinorhizobium meliloti]